MYSNVELADALTRLSTVPPSNQASTGYANEALFPVMFRARTTPFPERWNVFVSRVFL